MNYYNLHSAFGDYTITKFDDDLNVESTYIISPEGCTCPQGDKPTCRHRKMLPLFIMSGHIDDEWFLCFENGTWHTFGPLDQEPASVASSSNASPEQLTIESSFEIPADADVAEEFGKLLAKTRSPMPKPAPQPSTFVSGLPDQPLRRRI